MRRSETTSVVGRLVDHDHPGGGDPDHQHADLLRYFALRAVLPEPGIYDIEVDFGGGAIGRLPVQAFDPLRRSPFPSTGQPMPPVATPDGRRPRRHLAALHPPEPDGATSISSTSPSAVGNGRPLALLVATPALLRDRLLRAGVWKRSSPPPPTIRTSISCTSRSTPMPTMSTVASTIPQLEIAAPVAELGLTFEPSLFLVDSDGIVADRIDNIYGQG